MQPGIFGLSSGCGATPAIASTQTTPSCSALWASIGGAGDVADRINARHVRATQAIGRDAASVGLHAQRFQPEILDIAGDADRREITRPDSISLLRSVARSTSRNVVRPFLEPRDLRRGQKILIPCFSKLFLASAAISASSTGKNLRQHFDERHLGADGAIEDGEFDADRPRADDEQRRGMAPGSIASK